MSQTGGATILVVDDDEMNREIMEAFLSLDQYRVVTANTGYRALAVCAEAVPDLILLDVNMPDMTGYEICQALRLEPSTHLVPIIIVTGYSSKEDREAAMTAGANDFISRPFDAGQLLDHIRTLIQNHS